MGTGNLMSIGMRAMAANFAALETTGHNISNANVAGYSRQQVELETASGQFTGAGFFGKGVNIASVTRSHDEFLTREAVVAKSVAAGDEARYAQLRRLEQVFPTGEQGLGYAAGQFLNSMVDLASRPQDSSTREVVLARAQDVASRFATAGQQLDDLQAGVSQDLQNGIAAVNELTQHIAEVNDRIARLTGIGQPPNDLLDQREKMISDLSAYVQVTTIAANDGSVGVFMAGGQRLVLGSAATKLAVMNDEFDPSRQAVAMVNNGTPRALPPELLGSGSLGGLIRFQNEDLASARNHVGQMATALAVQLNEQQALGLDLRVPPGSGAPLFAIDAPQSLPATSNARDLAGNFLASVSMTIADSSQLQASEYELRNDPVNAGQYLLTRRSDGVVRSIASGDTVDGLTITVGAPLPAANDRFLLQAVTRGANGLRRALTDAKGLAAASPLEAVRGVTNTGTATVASLAVVDPSANPQNTATIAFTNASGAYTWALRDRTTNALVASGAGVWTAGSAIALNGFELRLDGVPASGDTFTVAQTAHPEASNGNALAMAGLRDAPMVNGQTITDAYASTMSSVGVRVQGARMSADISQGVAASAEAERSSKAGVNLDEEAARLMQYQQSYQAAAKVLQVAQSLFQTLLETAR